MIHSNKRHVALNITIFGCVGDITEVIARCKIETCAKCEKGILLLDKAYDFPGGENNSLKSHNSRVSSPNLDGIVPLKALPAIVML